MQWLLAVLTRNCIFEHWSSFQSHIELRSYGIGNFTWPLEKDSFRRSDNPIVLTWRANLLLHVTSIGYVSSNIIGDSLRSIFSSCTNITWVMCYNELCILLLGDVVPIKNEALKGNCWKNGKVEQLKPGADGRVCRAVLKTITSGRVSYIRPVQKLIPLERKFKGNSLWISHHQCRKAIRPTLISNAKHDVVTEVVDVVPKKTEATFFPATMTDPI